MAGFPSSTGNCKQSTSSKPALSICHLIDWKCAHIWKDLWKSKTWYFQLFHSKIWISILHTVCHTFLLNLNLGISCEIRLYLLGSTVYIFYLSSPFYLKLFGYFKGKLILSHSSEFFKRRWCLIKLFLLFNF